MSTGLPNRVSEYSRKHKRRRRWQKVVSCLGAAVVFCTTYALILPAITMESDPTCGMVEHTHGEECCESVTTPVYSAAITCAPEVHVHLPACYDETGEVICGLADVLIHTHDENCYYDGQLICPLPEAEEHRHSESCYEMVPTLVCTTPETPEGHTHGEECYQLRHTLTCGLDEIAIHTHSAEEGCFDASVARICGILAAEGHQHTGDCLTLTETGRVEEQRLVCTLPEHTHHVGCYPGAEDAPAEASPSPAPAPEDADPAPGDTPDTLLPAEPDPAPDADSETDVPPSETVSENENPALPAGESDPEAGTPPEEGGLTAGELTQAEYVAAQIAALPDADEISNRLAELEAAGDYEGMETWYAMVLSQLEGAQAAYDALNDAQRSQLPEAAERLAALSALLSESEPDPLTISGKILVYQVWTGAGWMDVGRSNYQTGTVNGETRAYITTDLATRFFGSYGYTARDGLTYSYNDIYTIYYGSSNYCIDIAGNVIANGTAIQLYQSNGSPAQKFRIWEFNGYSVISPVENSGYSINLYGGAAESGKTLALWNVVSDAASRWKVATSSDGCTTFASAVDESFLIDLPSGNISNNNTLHVWNQGTNTKWRLVQQFVEEAATYDGELIGLTQESNGSIVVRYTPAGIAANDTPTVVQSASTSEFIELNLYDYNGYINDRYDSNKKYPGFQWNGGAYMYSNTFNRHTVDYIDFGNSNITDRSYGASSTSITNGLSTNKVTVGVLYNNGSQDTTGAINWLWWDGTNASITNRPVGTSTMDTSALSRTLINGYPALADGSSLAYLFTNGTAVKKQNTESIDGLFQKIEATGEYYYNSRWNHAQYSDNKFTLYSQIITPNFIVYPFGNFLPFNTITDNSKATQVSKITNVNSYIETLINDMSGSLSGSPTKTQLTAMLEKYQASNTENGITTSKEAITDYLTGGPTSDTSLISDALLNKMYNIDWDEETNFFFGMDMSMNFFQPKGGLTGNDGQQPMRFYFTGDDDVWVYIDDVLFLDLTGIHRHVGGEIDFVNGRVYYYALDPANGGDVSDIPYKTYTFAELLTAAGKSTDVLNEKGTFKDYSTHTFKFYYMERGSGSSVCRMNFNFPLLRKNSISVTKELMVDDTSKLPLLGDPDFRFQVLKEGGSELFIGAGVKYDILDTSGNSVGTGTTDENGVFTLKAGQTAVFAGISENAGKYFVRELLDANVFGQYGTVSVNGSSVTENYNVTVGSDSFTGLNSPVQDVSNGSTAFRFNNQVTTSKLGSLTVTKTITDYPQKVKALEQFDFEVTLDGEKLPVGTKYTVGGETRTVTTAGIITLAPDETATLSNILAGTRFTVQETAASTKGYIVSYSPTVDGNTDRASGVIGIETNVAVTVNNAEKGASVEIPVTKTLIAPDGQAHTYQFTLTQVTDSGGQTPVENAKTQTLELTVTTETVNGSFAIDYPLVDLDTLPQIFYYKIAEVIPQGSTGTVYDETVYVIEVTVTEGEGTPSAVITKLWKDGVAADPSPPLTFTNQLLRYELPQTGGAGTFRYLAAGALLMVTAVLLLYRKRRGKGAFPSS